jgi:hypothetical protein
MKLSLLRYMTPRLVCSKSPDCSLRYTIQLCNLRVFHCLEQLTYLKNFLFVQLSRVNRYTSGASCRSYQVAKCGSTLFAPVPSVVEGCAQKQVTRTDANRIVALVANKDSERLVPILQLPCDPMGFECSSLDDNRAIAAQTITESCARPHPAVAEIFRVRGNWPVLISTSPERTFKAVWYKIWLDHWDLTSCGSFSLSDGNRSGCFCQGRSTVTSRQLGMLQ